jgi:hypothetical protein
MAFTVAQAIMIHRAQFTSNATVIAHLLFFEFRGLEATSATHGTKVPTKSQRRVCEASRVPADRKRGSIRKWVFTWWNTSGAAALVRSRALCGARAIGGTSLGLNHQLNLRLARSGYAGPVQRKPWFGSR